MHKTKHPVMDHLNITGQDPPHDIADVQVVTNPSGFTLPGATATAINAPFSVDPNIWQPLPTGNAIATALSLPPTNPEAAISTDPPNPNTTVPSAAPSS